jgi:hypothetical protein
VCALVAWTTVQRCAEAESNVIRVSYTISTSSSGTTVGFVREAVVDGTVIEVLVAAVV